MGKPAQTEIKRGAEALHDVANPDGSSFSDAPKVTQERFETYAEVVLTAAAGGDASGVEGAQPEPDVNALAIANYDSLTAEQIVSGLSSLEVEQIDQVKVYEEANKSRKGILEFDPGAATDE